MNGTMVFAKALLCLGRCLMATQHALCSVIGWLTFVSYKKLPNICDACLHESIICCTVLCVCQLAKLYCKLCWSTHLYHEYLTFSDKLWPVGPLWQSPFGYCVGWYLANPGFIHWLTKIVWKIWCRVTSLGVESLVRLVTLHSRCVDSQLIL